jgi:2-hydroxy-3-oxopropionate reductase
MLKVGYIGLGIMGKPIARNILNAGYALVVHNRSQDVIDELATEGAIPAFSPAEVASQVDVVFSNLPDSPDVEKVALGKKGIISGAHAGLIYVDNSTIKPATARKVAEELGKLDVLCLDAPVSGGDVGARKGKLAIMVGGPAEALEKVHPILKVIGKTITHVGGNGAGQIAKAANQIMVAAQMVAMGELLILAQKAGADAEKAIMQAKDLNIVLDTAHEYGVPLPATAVNAQLFHAMLQLGMENLDNSAVIGIIENLAGERLQTHD